MVFKVKKLKAIKTDSLDSLGDSVVDLAKFTEDEFAAVASALTDTEADKVWNAVPPKPRRGTYAYADGTNWNPGKGEGPYSFDGSTWHPLANETVTITFPPPFPSGTVMVFYQASAPTGWTKLTTQNDKALRVVSGSGGVAGGTNSFSTVMAQTVTGGHALTSAENGPHTHSYSATSSVSDIGNIGGVAGSSGPFGATTGSSGSGTAHTHPITMAMQYIDIILASEN